MSRRKQLSVVSVVANVQKQGVMGVRLVLASSTTMFQVSRRKQLSVVFGVANAQKQGVADAECIEAEDTTMFQEKAPSWARG